MHPPAHIKPISCLLLLLLLLYPYPITSKYIPVSNATHGSVYGVDISWPIHNFKPRQNSNGSPGDNDSPSAKVGLRGKLSKALWGGDEGEKTGEVDIGEGPSEVYKTHMEGCGEKYGLKVCESNEVRRIMEGGKEGRGEGEG